MGMISISVWRVIGIARHTVLDLDGRGVIICLYCGIRFDTVWGIGYIHSQVGAHSMTLDEALENDSTIGLTKLLAELERHGVGNRERILECRELSSNANGRYYTSKILHWLGY